MLGRAHAALAAGDTSSALDAVDAHDRSFPRGALRDEAAVLRIEALARAGRRGEALDEADRFLARAPASPHARRVRAVAASLR